MRVKTGDGHELEVRTSGDGALPVLFVHGWMLSGAVWDDVLEVLRPRGMRFIIPDLRGSGKPRREPEE